MDALLIADGQRYILYFYNLYKNALPETEPPGELIYR